MLREDRLIEITELIRKNGRVVTTDLMDHYDMSEGSIRRDLNELQDRGVLKKVFGGAIVTEGSEENSRSYSDESRILARGVLPFLEKSKVVYMSGGESARSIIPHLKPSHEVHTNHLGISKFLADSKASTFLLGGKINKDDKETQGYEIITSIETLPLDLVIIEADAFHPVYGVSTDSQYRAMTQHALCKKSCPVLFLIQSTILPSQKLYTVARAEDIEYIVVSDNIKENYKALLKSAPYETIVISASKTS